MKNIILVTGPFADGKTKLIGALQNEFRFRGIPFEQKIISDSPYMLEAVAWDDRETGGMNHMHSENGWPGIHQHRVGTALDFDFVVTGSRIQEYMFQHYFEDLSTPRPEDMWYFAELAGGVNIHPPDHPASRNDYSYLSMVDKLDKGKYATGWIDRLAYVIHPEVQEFSRRIAFNNLRKGRLPTADEVRLGQESWPLPDIVMHNTGKDDFPVLQEFLVSRGIHPGRIKNEENTGEPEFFKRIIGILEFHGAMKPERASIQKESR